LPFYFEWFILNLVSEIQKRGEENEQT